MLGGVGNETITMKRLAKLKEKTHGWEKDIRRASRIDLVVVSLYRPRQHGGGREKFFA